MCAMLRRQLAVVAIVFLLGLAASAVWAAGVPEIGQTSVWTDGPTLVYGNHLDGALSQYIYRNPGDAKVTDADLQASLERVLAGQAQPISAPAAEARWSPLTSADPYTLMTNVGAGAGALFLKNAAGQSAPYFLNAPEIWGLNPAKAVAGEGLTIWGVNLSHRFGLVGPDGKVAAILTAYNGYNGHSGRYEGAFYSLVLLPDGLKPGAYFVYNWAGLGDAGWSPAQPVTILAAPTAPTVFNVKDLGAKGDGVTDDTAALQRALAAAGKRGGGRVYLPAGRYEITETLAPPVGVYLVGDSRDATTIEPSRFAAFTSPFPVDALQRPATPEAQLNHMVFKGRNYIVHTGYPIDWLPEYDDHAVLIRLQDRTGVSELTFDVTATRKIKQIVLVGGAAGAECQDVVVDHCRLTSSNAGMYAEWPLFQVAEAIEVVSPVRYFRFTRNEFQNNTGAISFLPAAHRDGSISFNLITQADPHSAFVALGVGGERVLIQANVFQDTGRGKTGGAVYYAPRPVWRNCYLHNIFRNLRKSDGEILLYETGTAPALGTGTGGDAAHLTAAPEQPWTPDQWRDHRVLICGGCGMGQYRWVVGNTANSLAVDKPWRVVPDGTSKYMLLAQESLENVHLGNEMHFCHQWSGVFGAQLRNVWVNDVAESVSGGDYLWKIHGWHTQSLNLHLGAEQLDRGRIVIVNERQDPQQKLMTIDVPMVFGNEIRHSSFRRPSIVTTDNAPDGGAGSYRGKIRTGVGNPLAPMPGEEPGLGIYDSTAHPSVCDPDNPVLDTLPISTCWNLFADDFFQECPVGIQIGRRVAHTILWGNTYFDCRVPLRDSGLDTVETGALYHTAFQK